MVPRQASLLPVKVILEQMSQAHRVSPADLGAGRWVCAFGSWAWNELDLSGLVHG